MEQDFLDRHTENQSSATLDSRCPGPHGWKGGSNVEVLQLGQPNPSAG